MIFERLPRRQTAILLVVSLVVLALVGKRLAAAGTARAPAAQAVSLSQGRSVGGAAASPRLVVYVVGAVRHAGLVRLSEGARVADALERAGGPSRHADLTLVNLAAPVADGQQIVVPTRVAAGAGGPSAAGAAVGAPAKLSLASATLEQLDALPGHRPGDGAEDPRLASDPWAVALCRRPRRDPRHRACQGRAAAGSGDAVIRLQDALDRGWPAVALGALALGLAAANWVALPRAAGVLAGLAAAAASFRLPAPLRLGLAGVALAAAGLWWGGLRMQELDRSYLALRIGDPAAAQVVVTGAASRSPFAVRADGRSAPLRRRRAARAGAARAPGRARASSGRRARAPGAPGRPARARDRIR